MNIHSIAVPLDGSSFAEQALPLAARLARAANATLRLVTVHTFGDAWNPGPEYRHYSPELEKTVRQRELDYLEKVAITLRGDFPVECVLLTGLAAPALEEYLETSGTSLVVMASHGRGGLRRALLGNIADHLVRHVSMPVLVVRPSEHGREEPDRQRILVPLDGSALAEDAIAAARQMATLLRGELLLAMVVQPVPILQPPFVWAPDFVTASLTERELEARRYLEGMKTQLRQEGFTVQSRVRVARKISRSLLEIARDDDCSLVTMATHGSSGLDRAMLGSVADQVVRHGEVPVLLVRPDPVRETREDLAEVEAATS